ncbi:MAG: tetratricopeptide repeat protein, partial [Cyanobacteria bacterium P01_F01_bin.143]
MDDNLPLVYISTLLAILLVAVFFVGKEVIKIRLSENKFGKLQKKLKEQKGTAKEYYELGSLYLDKKLFVQSLTLFQKALKDKEIETENKALVYNAIGYAYFAQEQYDIAIRQYKEALKIYPEYVIALNNLANVYEKKQMIVKAVETYEKAFKYEPDNKIAKRRLESLKKRLVTSDS